MLAALEGTVIDMQQLTRDIASPDITARFEQDVNDAKALRVAQTPEFDVNGTKLADFGVEQFKRLVQDEVRKAYP